ncbi:MULTISPECIES: VOC family protein [Oceanisphaera]|uniref:VOC family protein n=1 Tax=Oceanisphaera ostreae TaxID=914151 RepID=A0ABW3KIT9_9GAMM
MNKVYPRNFSHIGISVPDLDRAVEFYTQVMGWYLIMKPTEIQEDDSAIGEMCTGALAPNGAAFALPICLPATELA